MVSDKPCHIFQSLLIIGTLRPLLSSGIDIKAGTCAALSPSDKPIRHLNRTDHQRRKLTKANEDATKERKVLTIIVKYKLNRNGVINEIADMGMMTHGISETLDNAARRT